MIYCILSHFWEPSQSRLDPHLLVSLSSCHKPSWKVRPKPAGVQYKALSLLGIFTKKWSISPTWFSLCCENKKRKKSSVNLYLEVHTWSVMLDLSTQVERALMTGRPCRVAGQGRHGFPPDSPMTSTGFPVGGSIEALPPARQSHTWSLGAMRKWKLMLLTLCVGLRKRMAQYSGTSFCHTFEAKD